MRNYYIPLLLVLIWSCTRYKNTIVTMETEAGQIQLELFTKNAPITVANFEAYVDKHFYTDGCFYRNVTLENQPQNKVKIEVIQGGIGWDENLPRLKPIAHENTLKTGILHKKGIISMARNEPGTASSEFFICITDQPELDYGGKRNADGLGFAAFGRVIKGMDVVKKIHNLPDTNQFFVNPVKIFSIKRSTN